MTGCNFVKLCISLLICSAEFVLRANMCSNHCMNVSECNQETLLKTLDSKLYFLA